MANSIGLTPEKPKALSARFPALVLYQPVLDDPVGYIAGGGQNNRILFGVLLELLLIIANIGTAVVIFPIVRRQSVELSLGYVTARLGYLMYSSGLVPRTMTWLGLVGGPLIILSGTLVLFGVADAGGALQGIATIPEGLWELSLGVYCALKGFRPSSPILQAGARENRLDRMPAATPA
jgi:Domain of unknown function (DUF4386)